MIKKKEAEDRRLREEEAAKAHLRLQGKQVLEKQMVEKREK